MRLTFWTLVRKVVFQWDAERIHHCFARLLALLGSNFPGRLLLLAISGASLRKSESYPVEIAGMRFRNPIGLAAGFDKDGKMVQALPHLGFGYVEVGTVTPRPQPGNQKPRLFRDPERFSLFNRMGFNSPGAEKVARNIAHARASGSLPENFRIGINLGKNKETSVELAAEDYRLAVAPFENLADYLVINVSSPNTPGLRDLQTVESLERIVKSVRSELAKWKKQPPVFLKLAPELGGAPLEDLIRAEKRIQIDGWVLSNTLGGYWKGGRGGWSGGALGMLPRDRLEGVHSRSALPIFSVGGILVSREVSERLSRGASAVQVYTGWIYFGPRWIPHLYQALKK